MGHRTDNVIRLQKHPGGVGAGIRSRFNAGRFEIVTTGPNDEFNFIGSDPYETHAYTGLVVPSTPSNQIDDARYLFLLARASFTTGEQSSDRCGVRLVGIRQYAELIARLPSGTAPLAPVGETGPPEGSTVTFRKEITSPLWHPADGDISWHVMIINNVQRDTRNPANADGTMYQDARSPALLYQIPYDPVAPAYVPPNDGRPWGTPIGASLGNIHDLRYKWRSDVNEYALDIPVPVPSDVCFFASVRQNDPNLNPTFNTNDCAFFGALSPEDQFVVAFQEFAQYGAIAGSLVFEENLGENVP